MAQSSVAQRRRRSALSDRHVRTKPMNAQKAQHLAHEYCLLNYGPAFCGGTPESASLPSTDLWVVPVVLTSPAHGIVGQVGVMVIEAATARVVSATPRPRVIAAAAQLDQEKRDDLEAAFLRTRGTIHLRARLSSRHPRAQRDPRQ